MALTLDALLEQRADVRPRALLHLVRVRVRVEVRVRVRARVWVRVRVRGALPHLARFRVWG